MSIPRWSLRLAVREGVANARSGRVIAAGVVVVCAWVTAAAGVVNAVDVSRLLDQEQRWVAAGGLTLIAEPADADTGAIDAARCDHLASLDGVDGAFAVGATGLVIAPSSAPGSDATLFSVTPGVLSFFDLPGAAGPTTIATAGAVERTGLVTDRVESFAVSAAVVDGSSPEQVTATLRVVDDERLSESLDGTYLVPASLAEATTCYVQTDAAHVRSLEQAMPGVLGDDGGPAVVYRRVEVDSFSTDFTTAYQERSSRWAWLAGAVVIGLLWALVQRGRRSRYAVYATFGAGARTRLVIQGAEWFVLSATGCLTGLALGVTLSLALEVDAHTAVHQCTGLAAAVFFTSSLLALAVALAPIGTILDTLKDRT
jgi:hypothetical protein